MWHDVKEWGGGWTNCSGLYTLPQLLKKNIMWA